MGSFIRGAVSKKKRRYQKNGFDLGNYLQQDIYCFLACSNFFLYSYW